MSSRVTHQLMRICAARLDEKVSAEEFVELIDGLVDMCAQTFGKEDGEAPRPLTGPNHFGVRWRNLGKDGPCEDCDGDVCTMNCGPARSAPPKPGEPGYKPAHQHRPRRGGGRKKISDETREQIRFEADMARDDDGKLPLGFVRGLATEHGVSDQTIYNILGD